MSEQLNGVDMASGNDWQSSVIQAKPFDIATAKVGDEIFVRGTIIKVDADDPGTPIKADLSGDIQAWLRPYEIAGVIPAPEPPRKDGWSADGRSLDHWHGVSAEERERRCEAARRAVEEAHRPKASGWRFTNSTIGKACFAFHDDGRGYFISWGDVIKATNPRTFADAIADHRRHEITAAEAYEIFRANWQGNKFCELTGYKP